MLTFNGTVPGPILEAWGDQTIIINVINRDISEAISVHWHGLHQRNSGWYDGIPWLTQCPQLPGEIFTQRFKAFPYGTFWYHSHVGIQLSDSLYGALIIHHKDEAPKVAGDFNVMFADVNHHVIGNAWFLYLANRVWDHLAAKYNEPEMAQRYQSLIINGRGRFFSNAGVALTHGPLSEFEVVQGNLYRFRVHGSQASTFVKFSIDGHRLQVVATDGRDLKPQWVTHVVVAPGERYDVLVVADQPVGNYWVRGFNGKHGLAILRYHGANPHVEPTTTGHPCNAASKCVVYNCEVTDHGVPFQECITFDRMRSMNVPPVPGRHNERIKESFFNFGFKQGPRVNGNKYQIPVSPILTQPGEAQENPCYQPCASGSVCECTYNHHLKLGEIQQFVLLSMGTGRSSHPIHYHGHHAAVVKVGLPSKDAQGNIIDNTDIICDETRYCNWPKWRNPEWGGNNIPGLNLHDPASKDTVLVPAGGYVIIRFVADNPGAWGMHCHIEPHLVAGMFVALIEGFETFDSFDLPPHFPTCRHYTPRHYRPREDRNYYGFNTEHANDMFGNRNMFLGPHMGGGGGGRGGGNAGGGGGGGGAGGY
ncbi:uncharacterized protein LOC141910847 [Tubulanus polymorphus]|uniref:uncharacterized protein LOC141910847 n=1 Tax=Tubulanus polymorphus TaxID=672921 RepID=UPI003DA69031